MIEDMKETGIECDICNTPILIVHAGHDYMIYWCKYCGTIHTGTLVDGPTHLQMCEIAGKVNW